MSGVSLEELKHEAEKLILLLENPQRGLASWNQVLGQTLEKLQGLIAQGLGK